MIKLPFPCFKVVSKVEKISLAEATAVTHEMAKRINVLATIVKKDLFSKKGKGSWLGKKRIGLVGLNEE